MRFLPVLLAGFATLGFAQDIDSSDGELAEGFQAPLPEEDSGFMQAMTGESSEDGFKQMSCKTCLQKFQARSGCRYLWYGQFRRLHQDFKGLMKAGCKKRCTRHAMKACHIRRGHFRKLVGLRRKFARIVWYCHGKGKNSKFCKSGRARKILVRIIHVIRRHTRGAHRYALAQRKKNKGFSIVTAEDAEYQPEDQQAEGEEGFAALASEDEDFGYELADMNGENDSEEGFAADSESSSEE